jgi:cytochrome c biogenesis protein ResB
MLIKGEIVEQGANVLIPNLDHKNFTFSDERIEGGTVVEGTLKVINGLRRGEPFTYRLFLTKDNKLIYQKNIKNMANATEVTLGADSSTTPTSINLKPAENFSKMKLRGVVVGGIAGFAYAKYKKEDTKKVVMYIGAGAILGYLVEYLIDNRRNIIVKPSK